MSCPEGLYINLVNLHLFFGGGCTSKQPFAIISVRDMPGEKFMLHTQLPTSSSMRNSCHIMIPLGEKLFFFIGYISSILPSSSQQSACNILYVKMNLGSCRRCRRRADLVLTCAKRDSAEKGLGNELPTLGTVSLKRLSPVCETYRAPKKVCKSC